jgi:hypothetical protein
MLENDRPFIPENVSITEQENIERPRLFCDAIEVVSTHLIQDIYLCTYKGKSSTFFTQ